MNQYSDKYAPVEHIIPFEPFPSGKKPSKPYPIYTDDRRAYFKTLPGETYANEVDVPATGLWQIGNDNPNDYLTEIIRVTLKRPEPVSLVVTPFTQVTDRLRAPMHLFAHTAPLGNSLETLTGRIVCEWGTGKARNWTYMDNVTTSLQFPAVTDLRISAYTHTTPVRVSAVAQIGYAHSMLEGTWTLAYSSDDVILPTNVALPNFARTLTGYVYGTDVNQYSWLELDAGIAGPGFYLNRWTMRPGLPPVPVIPPYAPVDVPLSGAVSNVGISNIVTLGASLVTAAVVKIRI